MFSGTTALLVIISKKVEFLQLVLSSVELKTNRLCSSPCDGMFLPKRLLDIHFHPCSLYNQVVLKNCCHEDEKVENTCCLTSRENKCTILQVDNFLQKSDIKSRNLLSGFHQNCTPRFGSKYPTMNLGVKLMIECNYTLSGTYYTSCLFDLYLHAAAA